LPKYDIIPFKACHWYSLRATDGVDELTGLPDEHHARILAGGGPAYSALAENKIIGIGGVFVLWPGNGEAWCLVSPEIQKHKFFFFRQSLRYLDMMARQHHLERIQAAVRVDFEAGLKFVEALGFQAEGIMEKYYRGRTFIRFAKIYEEGKT
jgi:hypothetical protein